MPARDNASLPPVAKAAPVEKIPTRDDHQPAVHKLQEVSKNSQPAEDLANAEEPTEQPTDQQHQAKKWNTESLSQLAQSLRQTALPPTPNAANATDADTEPVPETDEVAEANEPAENAGEEATATLVQPSAMLLDNDEADAQAPASNVSPQYRALRDNILEQLPADTPAVLLCTSADLASPDQTPMLAELSVALTQKCEGKVLLIDAKLQTAGMSQYFGMHADTGLTEVLQGACTWQEGISQTALERVDLLPSRVDPGMDFSLTMHANCDRLFDALRDQYRFVLVDAAPVAEPSARALAAKCDATYLVAQFDGTPWRQASESIEQLAMVGARVLGCILTGVPQTDLVDS